MVFADAKDIKPGRLRHFHFLEQFGHPLGRGRQFAREWIRENSRETVDTNVHDGYTQVSIFRERVGLMEKEDDAPRICDQRHPHEVLGSLGHRGL